MTNGPEIFDPYRGPGEVSGASPYGARGASGGANPYGAFGVGAENANPYRADALPSAPVRNSPLRTLGAILVWPLAAISWVWCALVPLIALTMVSDARAGKGNPEPVMVFLLVILPVASAVLLTWLAVHLTRRPRR